MRSKLILLTLVTLVLYGVSTGCAIVEPIIDYPISFFTEDEETGEVVEVTTTIGDAIADNSDGVGAVVSNALGGVSPLAALLGGGAAAALLGGARRKKKAAALAKAAAPAEEPEVKG